MDRGELIVLHCDAFVHKSLRRRCGVSRASLAAVVDQGRMPVLLAGVSEVCAARASGMDCLAVFLAPPTPKVLQ